MVKNIALAALVGLFATATLAEGEAKKDDTTNVNTSADAGKDDKKPEDNKKDEKTDEKK